MLIIQDFGIQVKRKHASGREISKVRHVTSPLFHSHSHVTFTLFYSQFLDKDKIAGTCINEGLTFTHVQFYLAFVVVGQPEMVVAYEVPLLSFLLSSAPILTLTVISSYVL